jgi:hypothetical protein
LNDDDDDDDVVNDDDDDVNDLYDSVFLSKRWQLIYVLLL